MLCERCNKNLATIHVLKIVNGKKKQLMLCEKCANIISDVPLAATFDEVEGFSFQKLLGGLVNYINSSNDSTEKIDIICSNCNTSYNDFKKTGYLGCSECYTNFYKNIISVIKKVHVDIEHIGKVPKQCGEYVVEKRKIARLKEELQKVVLVEEYERAAELRDEIKMIYDVISKERGKDGESNKE